MATVVIRLWEPAGDDNDDELRGVIQIVGMAQWLPFVGERALIDILSGMRTARTGTRLAGSGPGVEP